VSAAIPLVGQEAARAIGRLGVATTEHELHRIDQHFAVRYEYPVCFTRGAFEVENGVLRHLLGATSRRARVFVAVDRGVARPPPTLLAQIARYAEAHADAIELVCEPWVVRGGESIKDDPRELSQLYDSICDLRLCRHSYVIALGGGAMLDAIGYAAASAHRGLRLIRMPSTVLGQNDAGVGVKNAVNWRGRKNFLGAFTPPFAVVNDFDVLRTLPTAEQRDGAAEAVKVALIRDRAFFERLYASRHELRALERTAMEAMIVRCAELHLAHIREGGDPFERGSARPLDFGHWSAHKLEELSQPRLRHGEAVAIGIALDSLYSRRVGMLGSEAVELILTTLRELGFRLAHEALARLDVERALDEFREHLGGELCITLLEDIGRGVEVGYIDTAAMRASINELQALA